MWYVIPANLYVVIPAVIPSPVNGELARPGIYIKYLSETLIRGDFLSDFFENTGLQRFIIR
jgi:hypothetical protein